LIRKHVPLHLRSISQPICSRDSRTGETGTRKRTYRPSS
jgi:hypothetical protein